MSWSGKPADPIDGYRSDSSVETSGAWAWLGCCGASSSKKAKKRSSRSSVPPPPSFRIIPLQQPPPLLAQSSSTLLHTPSVQQFSTDAADSRFRNNAEPLIEHNADFTHHTSSKPSLDNAFPPFSTQSAGSTPPFSLFPHIPEAAASPWAGGIRPDSRDGARPSSRSSRRTILRRTPAEGDNSSRRTSTPEPPKGRLRTLSTSSVIRGKFLSSRTSSHSRHPNSNGGTGPLEAEHKPHPPRPPRSPILIPTVPPIPSSLTIQTSPPAPEFAEFQPIGLDFLTPALEKGLPDFERWKRESLAANLVFELSADSNSSKAQKSAAMSSLYRLSRLGKADSQRLYQSPSGRILESINSNPHGQSLTIVATNPQEGSCERATVQSSSLPSAAATGYTPASTSATISGPESSSSPSAVSKQSSASAIVARTVSPFRPSSRSKPRRSKNKDSCDRASVELAVEELKEIVRQQRSSPSPAPATSGQHNLLGNVARFPREDVQPQTLTDIGSAFSRLGSPPLEQSGRSIVNPNASHSPAEGSGLSKRESLLSPIPIAILPAAQPAGWIVQLPERNMIGRAVSVTRGQGFQSKEPLSGGSELQQINPEEVGTTAITAPASPRRFQTASGTRPNGQKSSKAHLEAARIPSLTKPSTRPGKSSSGNRTAKQAVPLSHLPEVCEQELSLPESARVSSTTPFDPPSSRTSSDSTSQYEHRLSDGDLKSSCPTQPPTMVLPNSHSDRPNTYIEPASAVTERPQMTLSFSEANIPVVASRASTKNVHFRISGPPVECPNGTRSNSFLPSSTPSHEQHLLPAQAGHWNGSSVATSATETTLFCSPESARLSTGPASDPLMTPSSTFSTSSAISSPPVGSNRQSLALQRPPSADSRLIEHWALSSPAGNGGRESLHLSSSSSNLVASEHLTSTSFVSRRKGDNSRLPTQMGTLSHTTPRQDVAFQTRENLSRDRETAWFAVEEENGADVLDRGAAGVLAIRGPQQRW